MGLLQKKPGEETKRLLQPPWLACYQTALTDPPLDIGVPHGAPLPRSPRRHPCTRHALIHALLFVAPGPNPRRIISTRTSNVVVGYSPRQGFGSHGRILRPGRNRTPPLADSASVPATGRQPSPVSTRAVIVTVLAVPALHTPASCRLAPPAFFIEDPSSTGSDPELHSSSVPPREHQGTTMCPHEDFIAPPSWRYLPISVGS